MKTATQWVPEVRAWVDQVRNDPPSIGVLSMGQQCAVALVLDAETMLNPDGEGGRIPMRPRSYTWLDCVFRIEPELLAACLAVQRE